jgi:hypothetical protein
MPTEGLKSAADATKQIITLSSGIVALTVTFAKEFKTGNELVVPWQLKGAWIIFGLAIASGLWTLLAVTGNLVASDKGSTGANAMDLSVQIPAIGMVTCFLVAFSLTVWSGFVIIK